MVFNSPFDLPVLDFLKLWKRRPAAPEADAPECLSYDSALSGCCLELDERQRTLSVFRQGARASSAQAGFEDLVSYEVLVNEEPALQVGGPEARPFDSEAEGGLRARLRDLQYERMGRGAKRQLDLRIQGRPESGFECTINFYYREGSRRLSPYSFRESVQDLVV